VSDSARFAYTTIAHSGRALLGPLCVESAEALLARVEPAPRTDGRPAVLDVGCGKGELLLRAMRRLAARGTGVDPNPAFVADARRRARELGLEHDLALHACALADVPEPLAPADLAICTGATHAFGDLAAALAGLRALTREGGWAIVGTGYWRQAPAAGYLALLGAAADELPPLAGALAAAEDAGWRVERRHASTREEWDDYEGAYAAAVRSWLVAHPDHADAAPFRARIDAWQLGYTRWGRDTLGFATLLLQRPAAGR
jgi:cyclopropane fatty-acyl-phospholipid synthase-like methyltransferase